MLLERGAQNPSKILAVMVKIHPDQGGGGFMRSAELVKNLENLRKNAGNPGIARKSCSHFKGEKTSKNLTPEWPHRRGRGARRWGSAGSSFSQSLNASPSAAHWGKEGDGGESDPHTGSTHASTVGGGMRNQSTQRVFRGPWRKQWAAGGAWKQLWSTENGYLVPAHIEQGGLLNYQLQQMRCLDPGWLFGLFPDEGPNAQFWLGEFWKSERTSVAPDIIGCFRGNLFDSLATQKCEAVKLVQSVTE